jgi:hypothetical protein
MVHLIAGATLPENQVRAFESDMCITCDNVSICPLLGAIVTEVAIFRYEDVIVQDCGLYKRKIGDSYELQQY